LFAICGLPKKNNNYVIGFVTWTQQCKKLFCFYAVVLILYCTSTRKSVTITKKLQKKIKKANRVL